MNIDHKYMKLRAIILCIIFILTTGTSLSASAQQLSKPHPAGPYIFTHSLNYNENAKAIMAFTAFGTFCIPLKNGTSVRGPLLTINIWDHDEFYAMSSPYCASGTAMNGLSIELAYDHLIPTLYLVIGSKSITTVVR